MYNTTTSPHIPVRNERKRVYAYATKYYIRRCTRFVFAITITIVSLCVFVWGTRVYAAVTAPVYKCMAIGKIAASKNIWLSGRITFASSPIHNILYNTIRFCSFPVRIPSAYSLTARRVLAVD